MKSRPLRLVLLGSALVAGACVAHASQRAHAFVCDGGKAFEVTYAGGEAIITTEAGRWSMSPRPSSIGRKFASSAATFIHDEDRAALNGLPGGPFRHCREGPAPGEPRQAAARRPERQR